MAYSSRISTMLPMEDYMLNSFGIVRLKITMTHLKRGLLLIMG